MFIKHLHTAAYRNRVALSQNLVEAALSSYTDENLGIFQFPGF